MFEDPVCAGQGRGEASGDAVAGCFYFGKVEVDFGYDAGYVDALEVLRVSVSERILIRGGHRKEGRNEKKAGRRKERRTANAAAAEVWRDDQGGELLGCDFALANCTFEAGVCVFEDVEAIIHVVVVSITFDNWTSESTAYGEEDWCKG